MAADPDIQLFSAAVAGDLAALNAALASGADPNKREKASRIPPLAWAARLGHARCVAPLLSAGADPWAQGPHNVESAIGYAMAYAHWDILESLIAGSAIAPNPHQLGEALRKAVVFGKTPAIGMLVRAGADAEQPWTPGGPPPLSMAAYGKNEESLSALLAAGADPNASYGNPAAGCAAKRAIEANWPRGLELLLAAGADPRGPEGSNALARSAVDKGESAALLSALERAGLAAANGEEGRHLLASAAWAGNAEAALWLCQRGADPSIPIADPSKGPCALEIAKNSPESECSALIEAFCLASKERSELGSTSPRGSASPARTIRV